MKKSQNNNPTKKRGSTVSLPSTKHRTRYFWLNVLPEDLWLQVRQGDTVWDAFQKEGLDLKGDCGGLGKCGKCKVRVLTSIDIPSKEEEEYLDEEEVRQGIRLACRTKVDKDLVIHTGETDADAEYFQILKSGHLPRVQLDPLVSKQVVTLSPIIEDEGLSDLDRIKLAMGPEYQDLLARLHCLRTLPEMLERTQNRGTAVLHEKCLMTWQDWEQVHFHYGLVFDLGTSTVVGKLINIMDGSEVAVVSCLNSQIKYGTNVISRLQYVKEHKYGLGTMHNLLIKDITQITSRLLKTCNLDPEDILVAVAAGNTTMQHFLLNLNPLGIAEAPFCPVLTDGLILKTVEVGIQMHPETLLYTMPMKSGYIGGDLISVILASGAVEQDDEIVLGLDLGTNGEIFLGNGRRLMTCSAAAGPALEGARISHGMIARTGAIESVEFYDGDLHYRDIGNIKPKGICGSGLVELIAMLLHLGIITNEGLIQPPEEDDGGSLRARLINRSGVYDFLIASAEESYDNRPIYLTQKDVRELQMATGAIGAGIRILMSEMGIGPEDIKRVYLAGALGNYVDPLSAMRVGIIPKFDLEIISSLGNAASTGATMVLLSKGYWTTANDISHFMEHIELSSRLDFNEYYIEQMDFPKENMW